MISTHTPVTLDLLVGHFPLRKYSDTSGDTFVEGRKGSEYSLRITNHRGDRVLAIPSVDGLSVFDGKPASENSRGYILAPHRSIKIPGWTLDNQAVAAFKFGEKERSYVAVGDHGDVQNAGVVGLLVYSERPNPIPVPAIAVNDLYPHYTYPQYWNGWPYQNPNYNPRGAYLSNILRGASVANGVAANGGMQSMAAPFIGASVAANSANSSLAESQLGTEFGRSVSFATRSEEFDKFRLLQSISIFYDSAKGLRARGIEVVRNHPTPKANPFPGAQVGCNPPADWIS